MSKGNFLGKGRAVLFFLLLSAGLVAPAAADEDPREKAKREVEFGIEVARAGLWKEAIYRWQKAVELDPQNASARNNLGVAYEQAGEFERAEKEYKRALELDAGNMYIRQNFELFREAYERKKRTDRRSSLR
ncbi:MAG: tetratricopeptide repeat protein [Acidobacteriota bacterium]